MKPRPKPLVGLLLGLLLGLVVVGLLWQLGVAPPDRFILFGVVAVSIAVTELLVTQTTRRGKKRFVTVMLLAGVFGGVALTGIPETFMNAGSLSDGCTLAVTSGDETATPTDTSAFDPLDTTPTGTIEWESSTDTLLTNWDSGLGMYIGGIPLPVFTAERANAEHITSWSSTEEVADYLDKIEDAWGVQLRGTYHAYGYIHADEGDCEMAGYIRVNAEGVFATPLIIGLWAATGLLAIVIVWIAVSVVRSIRDAKRFAAQAGVSTASGTLGTGGSAAPDAGPIGAFTSPQEEVPLAAPSTADAARAEQPEQAANQAKAAAAASAARSKAAEPPKTSTRDAEPVAQTVIMPASVEPVMEPEPELELAPESEADAETEVLPQSAPGPEDRTEPDEPRDEPNGEPNNDPKGS